jgi:hypothetical protein
MENEIPKVEKPKKNFPKNKNAARILRPHREVLKHFKKQGYRNIGNAIRKTGAYSETVATRPTQITYTQSWKMLMKEHLPDEKLALRHSELLDKRSYRTVTNDDGTKKEIDAGPETNAVSKGLELAYKLKGSFSKEEGEKPSTVMYNLFYKPEVREQMKTFEAGLKQSLFNEINKRNVADLENIRNTHIPPEGSGADDGEDEGNDDEGVDDSTQ